MASSSLDARSEKWIKEGRGSGTGKDYRPWLTVRDVPSTGRSHRVWGFQTGRTHHLLSDLELAAFFLFDWNPHVTDIREQYPLRLDDTLEIATQAGIRHPAMKGQPQVMSTDFLLDTKDESRPKIAIQAKTSSDLAKPRTIEKLELERRYWEGKGIPWYLITEKEIPKAVTGNIAWLYPAQAARAELEALVEVAPLYGEFFSQNPTWPVSQAAMALDQAYTLAPGESLQKIRSLMALRYFLFDMTRPWSALTVGDLQVSPDARSLRDRYAANQ
ncbi:TnsA endonuclease N-terminal domain-containing protein [Acidiferrobacter sp.]|uniref:TnsA endonuclease N-terminal domain-containing protein n=1 Tax=Acidiferrobacter sp. TaxID=1872107 RepID=UPI00262F7401|nr:TnsA endonuclease N-terminal domain-containing protein [Acidiferrobacter sp.]